MYNACHILKFCFLFFPLIFIIFILSYIVGVLNVCANSIDFMFMSILHQKVVLYTNQAVFVRQKDN